MNFKTLKNLTINIVLFFLITITHAFATPIQLRVVYENTEIVPYQMGDSYDVPDLPGIYVEAVKLLERDLDIKVEFSRAPWKRCLSMLKKGKVDALFYASYKKKREAHGAYPQKDGQVDPSRRMGILSYSIYRIKGGDIDIKNKKVINIQDKIIGAPRGYSIVDDLKSMGVEVQESPSTKFDFEKLSKGRINAAAALTSLGDSLLAKNNKFSAIEKIEPPIKLKNYYLMISHQFQDKYPELAERIWMAIARIRENDELTLLKKYDQ